MLCTRSDRPSGAISAIGLRLGTWMSISGAVVVPTDWDQMASFTPMLGANGRPRPELYLADSLHMTPAGYALWRERLAPLVRRGSEGRGR